MSPNSILGSDENHESASLVPQRGLRHVVVYCKGNLMRAAESSDRQRVERLLALLPPEKWLEVEQFLLNLLGDETPTLRETAVTPTLTTDTEHMLAGILHDLREPLRVVNLLLQLLERRYGTRFDTNGRELLALAQRNVLRMRELMESLLEYARTGIEAVSWADVDGEEILRHVLETLVFAIREEDAEITSDPLPVVRTDALLLERILRNLLANCLRFHGERPPRIHISAERRGDEWVFSVRDNGVGISPDIESHVFEMFRRGYGTDAIPGTGIGLAFCKRSVERLGGRIWFESRPGEGTTFFFALPTAQ